MWALARGVSRKAEADARLRLGQIEEAQEVYLAVLPRAREAGHFGLIVTALNSLGGSLYLSGEYQYDWGDDSEGHRLLGEMGYRF